MRIQAILAVVFTSILPLAAQAQTPANIVPKPKPAVEAPKAAIPQEVNATNLAAPKLDAIGITGEENGFDQTLWAGSTYNDIAPLVEKQDLTLPSIAAHQLLTRLLTAPAMPEMNGLEEGEWLKLRLRTLFMIGEEKTLKDMLGMIPADQRGEFTDRLLAEQELLRLNTAKACEIIEQGITTYKGIFWLQAHAFCLAKNKKVAEADLALQLLREQKSDEKSDFPLEDSIRKIAGEKPKIPVVETFNLSPLALVAAVEAGLSFNPQIDKENGEITPAAARFLAINSRLSLSSRTQLAERAFRTGILSREQLIELYEAANFKPEVVAKATKEKQFSISGVDARALAYQLSEKMPERIPEWRKHFPPDLAQRLFAPNTQADQWKQLPADKNIRIAALHKIFGLPVDKTVWEGFANQKESADGANIAALDKLRGAAAAKRKGETALLGLWLIRYAENSVTLAAVMEALQAVGLEEEAGALAADALLADE